MLRWRVSAMLGLALALAATPALPQQPAPQQQAEASPASLGAIAPYIGIPIQYLEMPGVDAEEANRLLAATPLKLGEPLTRQGLHDAIQWLFATGRFADIQAEAEHAGAGVRLRFLTTANYFVGQVFAQGVNSNPSASQVVRASRLELGELYNQEKLDRALASIQRLLEDNGFHRARVTSSERRDETQHQVDVTFRVQPGARAAVGKITLEGDAGYSLSQIEEIAKVHSGDQVVQTRLTRALQRVRAKYQQQDRLLARVTAAGRTYQPESNRVDYVLRAERGPVVQISAEGFSISQRTLRKLVPIYEEGAVDEDLLNEGKHNLRNYMETLGYFDAVVDVNQHTTEDGKVVHIVYVVNPGDRRKLVAIRTSGNRLFDESQIRAVMEEQAAGRLFSHGHYSEALLANDVESVENLYRAQGYRQVEVASKLIRNFGDDPNQLAIDLNVKEGPQTMVSWVRMDGNYTVPTEQLLELAKIETAERQGFNESILAEDRDKILGLYFNNGFPNASVDVSYVPVPSSDEVPTVGVTFTIQEGEQFFVTQVFVLGLQHTRPGVVQRELKVQPGAFLSQKDMLETQRGLYGLGLFSEVDTAVQNPDGTESRKNVLISAKEAQRYTFDYGFGFEFQTGQPAAGTNQPLGQTGVSPRVSFGLSRINFGGRHQTVNMKGTVSRLQQRGLINFDAPKLMNRELDFRAIALYDNTIDVSTFTSERLEGTIQAQQVLSKRPFDDRIISTLTYGFSYRRVKASNIQVTSDLIPLLSKPTRVGIPNFEYLRNKRDNDLESTRGNYTSIDGGVASSVFGSEADFGRLLIKNTTYHAFGWNRKTQRGFVFARSTSIGVENPFGSTVLIGPAGTVQPGQTLIPLPERFFSGGGNSHRGFGLNQAGPRDPFTGFPLGGSGLFVNNLELRFPNIALPYLRDNIGFTVFHDMGNVFDTPEHMVRSIVRWHQSNPDVCTHEQTHLQCDYNYLSHAIGLGVRYQTPIGPLRFDFGYNLNPPVFPSYTNVVTDSVTGISTGQFGFQRAGRFNFSFSIGQTF